MLKIQFVKLDFYNLIFQKSSTDQQGGSIAKNSKKNYCRALLKARRQIYFINKYPKFLHTSESGFATYKELKNVQEIDIKLEGQS